MELFKASRQWADRPADQRFWNLNEMKAATSEYRMSAGEATVKFGDIRVEAQDGEIVVVGKKNLPARLTHWSFGQVCQRAGAPSGYLRGLPATLAAQNLNHGLSDTDAEGDDMAKLLFHKNGDYVLRAATGVGYARVWNDDIVRRLQDMTPKGWRVPPAKPSGVRNERTRFATQQDVLECGAGGGLKVQLGDVIAPAGLYASDHDMFAFLVNDKAVIDDGTGHGLRRGFFVWNSEVGASSFGLTTFLFDGICGNHIVWGAKGVRELRVRHIGDANGKTFQGIRAELVAYADESASDLEAKIKRARAFEFGKTKDEAVDAAFKAIASGSGAGWVSRKRIAEAHDVAEIRVRYGSPRSAWGLVNGLTELSQETEHADARVAADRAAGKLLEQVEF